MAILMMIGLIIFVIGGLWLLVVTFQTSIIWGIASIIFPVLTIVFLVMHWDKGKKPFFYQLIGFCLMLASAFLAPQHAQFGT